MGVKWRRKSWKSQKSLATLPPTRPPSSQLREKDPQIWTQGSDWHPEWRVWKFEAFYIRARKVTKVRNTVPTFFIWSTTYHNCSRFGFCVIFSTVFLPNNIVWATYKTLLVYLASIKASASYQQIFVVFNQKCATTAELVFKHGQLPLSTYVPCVFLYVFTIFDARIETGKHGGNVSVHIRMQKYQCNFFGWIWVWNYIPYTQGWTW